MEVYIKLVIVLVLFVFEGASFRIAGGSSISITEVPYTVALLLPKSRRAHCTGSIIAPNIIVTAAHCFKFEGNSAGSFVKVSQPKLLVRAGSASYNHGGELAFTTNVTFHPKWMTDRFYYDIAIARLETAFCFDSNIKSIALPKHGDVLTPGTIGKVIGYGFLANESLPNQLQAVDLPVMSYEKCDKIFEKREIEYSPLHNKSTFCAGFENQRKNACPGDSGGPFVVNNVLYGITSFSSCGSKNPTFFFEVSQYVNEINDVVTKYSEE